MIKTVTDSKEAFEMLKQLVDFESYDDDIVSQRDTAIGAILDSLVVFYGGVKISTVSDSSMAANLFFKRIDARNVPNALTGRLNAIYDLIIKAVGASWGFSQNDVDHRQELRAKIKAATGKLPRSSLSVEALERLAAELSK